MNFLVFRADEASGPAFAHELTSELAGHLWVAHNPSEINGNPIGYDAVLWFPDSNPNTAWNLDQAIVALGNTWIAVVPPESLEIWRAAAHAGVRDFVVRRPGWGMVLIDRLAGTAATAAELPGINHPTGVLGLVVESVSQGIVVADPGLKISYVNRAFEQLTGYSRDRLIGSTFGRLHGPGTDPLTIKYLQTALQACLPFEAQLLCYRHDASTFWGEVGITPIFGRNGTQVGWSGLIRDITESRQAAMALQRSEDQYRDLVESSRSLICLHDLEGNLVSINHVAAEVTGYTQQELARMNLRQLLDPDSHEALNRYLQNIKTVGFARGVMKIRTADGGIRHWEYHNTIRIDGTSRPMVRGVAHDITDRLRIEGELRRSRQTYLQLVKHIQEGILVDDLDGRITFINDRCREIFGIEEETLPSNLTFEDLAVPEWRAKLRHQHDLRISGGNPPSQFQYQGLHASGRRLWIEVTVTAVKEQDRIVGTQSTIRDITETKQRENILRLLSTETAHLSGQDLLNTIVGRTAEILDAGAGFLVEVSQGSVVPQLRLTVVRPRLGHPEPEVLNTVIRLNPDDLTGLPGGSWSQNDLRSAINRMIRDANLTNTQAVPLRSPDGEFIGKVGIASESSARLIPDLGPSLMMVSLRLGPELSRMALQQSFTDLFSQSADAILLIVLDGKILAGNPASQQLFEIELEKLKGTDAGALLPGLFQLTSTKQRVHGDLITDNQPWGVRFHAEGRNANGVSIPLELSLIPSSSDANPLVIVTIRDRRPHLEAEAARRALETQVQHTRTLEALGTLAGGVAHDFNNLLATMLGHLDLVLTSAGLPESVQSSLSEVQRAGHRATTLVSQLLSLSGRVAHRQSLASPVELIERTVQAARLQLPPNVAITIESPIEIPQLLIDSAQIEQALSNLIENARESISDVGGEITIKATSISVATEIVYSQGRLSPGLWAAIEIRDNGSGIKPEVLPKIFEPFFSTRTIQRKRGLGLPVAHRLIADHGGTITIASNVEVGTTVTVYLPIGNQPQPQPHRQIERITEHPSATLTTATQNQLSHVYFIDDEEQLVRFAKLALEKIGHRVSGFTSGEAAIQTILESSESIDMVITDHNMPGMAGLDVAREINRLRPGTPVVIISGDPSSELLREAESIGVKHVLQKPFRLRDLFGIGSSPSPIK